MITRNIACGCQRFRVSPQVSGEERHRLFGLWGIDIAKLPDGGQAIVQEVGLNLGQPDGDPPSGGGISQILIYYIAKLHLAGLFIPTAKQQLILAVSVHTTSSSAPWT